MPSRYPTFDRATLNLLPLADRRHDFSVSDILPIDQAPDPFEHPDLVAVATAMAKARKAGAAVILLMGAHVIRSGLSRYVIDWIHRGWVSAVAMNGACAIHDFELALIGATTESVARYIRDGQFGLWRETGEINDVLCAARSEGLGFGEAIGRAIIERQLPHRDISIFAAALQRNVPATVHVGIGYDIIHEHPNFDGAITGEMSYRDFLIFAKIVEGLTNGVVLCYGTSIMGPEIFLKALAMTRNVAHQHGQRMAPFTSAVFDLVRLSGDLVTEPSKDSPEYYFRPFKTLLVRTVRDGGQSLYIRGSHRFTMPSLHRLLSTSE